MTGVASSADTGGPADTGWRSEQMVLARNLRPGDVIDIQPLIKTYGGDVDGGTRMAAEAEMAVIEAVTIEPSTQPGPSEIAVLYSQLSNLAVDADAEVAVHHHDSDWDA
jgi:hypothetical protein